MRMECRKTRNNTESRIGCPEEPRVPTLGASSGSSFAFSLACATQRANRRALISKAFEGLSSREPGILDVSWRHVARTRAPAHRTLPSGPPPRERLEQAGGLEARSGARARAARVDAPRPPPGSRGPRAPRERARPLHDLLGGARSERGLGSPHASRRSEPHPLP